MNRRELIKRFGIIGFMLHPLCRAMAQSTSSLQMHPRFISIFKGGGFVPDSFFPAQLSNLSGKVIEPLSSFSSDLVLFRNLNMGNGDYQDEAGRHHGDEHGGGMNICFTGGRVYGFNPSNGDSYYWGTYDESVDQRIADHYAVQPDTKDLPFKSLQVGVGVTSIDKGQIFMSHRKGSVGQRPQANGLAPIQDPALLYDKIFGRLLSICSSAGQQPVQGAQERRVFLLRRKSLVDIQLENIKNAKRTAGLGQEELQKFDGMLDGLREVEKQYESELASTGQGGSQKPCPTYSKPNPLGGSQLQGLNIDNLKTRYNQMNELLKIAFEWDLTRVASIMLATGSNEQYYPGGGAPDRHHVYAHASNVAKLNAIDKYHAEKIRDFLAGLKSINDGGGRTGLNNSTVIVGMDTFNGPVNGSVVDHSKSNMPFILAGQGGGKITTGQIVDARGRAHNDLLLSALRASGITDTTFGKAAYCKGPIV